MNSNLIAFLRLSRLHFLAGGALMFALGALLAGDLSPGRYFAAQLMVTAAQLTAHYVNEYADFEADKRVENRTSFSGGSGVLATGSLPRIVALRAGQWTTAITALAAMAVATFSPVAALLGMLALAVSWAYSMPPVRLLSTGWGELATAVTVAGLVPLIGTLSQADFVPPALWWMIAALIPLQIAMLLAFELPDLTSDAAAGKRVLGVRLGKRRAVALLKGCFSLSYAMLAAGHLVGALPDKSALTAALLTIAPVTATIVAVHRHHHAMTTFGAVAAFFLCGTGLFVG